MISFVPLNSLLLPPPPPPYITTPTLRFTEVVLYSNFLFSSPPPPPPHFFKIPVHLICPSLKQLSGGSTLLTLPQGHSGPICWLMKNKTGETDGHAETKKGEPALMVYLPCDHLLTVDSVSETNTAHARSA